MPLDKATNANDWTLPERIWLQLAKTLCSNFAPNDLSRRTLAFFLRQLHSQTFQEMQFGTEWIISQKNFFDHRHLTLFLRMESSDVEVYNELFRREEYGPFIKYVQQYGNPEDIVRIIDAGSNIGLAAFLFARHFPKAAILCIEPEPGSLEMLRLHLQTNGLDKCCEVIPSALWSQDKARLRFDHQFRDGKDWSTRVVSGKGSIRPVTLPGLMHQYRWPQIDLLKIDIEGSEKELLEAPAVAESFLPYTRFLVVEIHPEITNLTKVEQTLRQFHFDIQSDKDLLYGRNLRPQSFSP